MEGEVETPHIEQRRRFKSLLVQNPNYFGTAPDIGLPPELELAQDTAYEELTCIGYNPFLGQLEATVQIKLPGGYLGDLCQAGSTEYVRFFADYGGGWQDLGVTGFNAHDIPTTSDCAGARTKPLSYVASLPYRPPGRMCLRPLLPNILAILSWENLPTAGDPTFVPIWGNRLERHIQIAPARRPFLADVLEELKAKLPYELKYIEQIPIDLPDPPPPDLAELAKLHKVGREAAEAARRPRPVEPHRFGFESVQAALTPGAFGSQQLITLGQQWKQLGLDLAEAVATLEKTSGDVAYEELDCVGLDYNREILAASFVIKRPTGYSGTLCQHGSTEYVAFWADWDDSCEYQYIGTAQVRVHDIAGIPADGLHYAAFMPATGIDQHRQPCQKPKIARIRAVLSWATPPSTTDPDDIPHWGNRLDTHVQIRPGEPEPPFSARIRNIGGIAVEDIDTASGGTGMTLTGGPPVHFAHFPSLADSLGRACPFGGLVIIEGQFFFPSYRYRVSVRRETDPPGVVSYLTTPFDVERVTVGYSHQVAGVGGFFNYLDPAAHFDRTLALWYTGGDERWVVQLEIRDPANNPHFSQEYTLQLDNTAPFVDIEITSPGGDCADFPQGTTVQGLFVARDDHFGSWSLATLPNSATIPSNQPVPAGGLLPTSQTPPRVPPPPVVPWMGGHGWSLDTGTPVQMRTCGYVVQVSAADRSIVGSHPGGHNWNHTETGLCLRKP